MNSNQNSEWACVLLCLFPVLFLGSDPQVKQMNQQNNKRNQFGEIKRLAAICELQERNHKDNLKEISLLDNGLLYSYRRTTQLQGFTLFDQYGSNFIAFGPMPMNGRDMFPNSDKDLKYQNKGLLRNKLKQLTFQINIVQIFLFLSFLKVRSSIQIHEITRYNKPSPENFRSNHDLQ